MKVGRWLVGLLAVLIAAGAALYFYRTEVAVALMRRAGIDDRTIAIVARKMESGDGEH